ncbi:hypothetical protein PTSG_05829 [Salpingoeca rosetta]|uniref:RRM domain-containing protein n=1 Tax=Salpingoeca rosetta (strain ATCC 50818 / BSB-021) TaxID=946362 RepID=F2UCX0_SALR5|nr:uncharacterized protein PTSG_05829 [Salpingoeca rosetta]EGD74465.1 hypothetical protein PTSG_05829 [Salpingoeca rosetta]|eukprot:XP_004992722.1 hypothetical protein PTSG_05829 [Salpingoeca rosetta]
MTTRVSVKGLDSAALNEEALSVLFEDCTIKDVEVVSSGAASYAIVTFKDDSDVQRAKDNVDGQFVGKKQVSVTPIADSAPASEPARSDARGFARDAAGPGSRGSLLSRSPQQPASSPPSSRWGQSGGRWHAGPGRAAADRFGRSPPSAPSHMTGGRRQSPSRTMQGGPPPPPSSSSSFRSGGGRSAAPDALSRGGGGARGPQSPGYRGGPPPPPSASSSHTHQQPARTAPTSAAPASSSYHGRHHHEAARAGCGRARWWRSFPKPSFQAKAASGDTPALPYQHPQFVLKGATDVDTISFVPSDASGFLPSESQEDIASGKFVLCTLKRGAAASAHAVSKEEALELQQQLRATITSAQDMHAACSARILFGMSYFVLPKECAHKPIPPSEVRQMLAEQYIRHILNSHLPQQEWDELTYAICNANAQWQYVGGAVAVEARYSDGATALFTVDKHGDLTPDTHALDMAASLRTPKPFLTRTEAADKLSSMTLEPSELTAPQTLQRNERYDLINVAGGWYIRLCTARVWKDDRKRYQWADMVHRRLGDNEAGPGAGKQPHFPAASTVVLHAGLRIDYTLELSEVPPSPDETSTPPAAEEALRSAINGIVTADTVMGKLGTGRR